MSVNVGHALTGERFNKNRLLDIICDPDTYSILNNVNPNSASKSASTDVLLQMFADIAL